MPNSEKTHQRSELKARLEELYDQLVQSSQISPADRDLLGKMVVGVLQLEDDEQEIAETTTLNQQSLREALEQKSLQYEAQHPKLAFTLRQILDILTRMGI
jgi:uncharacterized phage infection (PIP) family protein YhgE